MIPFLVWDEIFTRQALWGFTHEHLAGIYILNLPIEEILFFIIIPYCCVFTYEVFLKLTLKNINLTKTITLIIGIATLVLGVIFYDKIYTTVTFTSLGILLIAVFYNNKKFLQTFYLTYIVISLSFFILINGILTGGFTGGFLAKPPVWYNNDETFNIRIWTIPAEDFFYSMLLLLSNVWVYEIFKSKSDKTISKKTDILS